jgi:hypothetical protein
MKNGEYASQMVRFIKENKLSEVNMCIAATLDGGIYLPMALCAQMYRVYDGNFEKILDRVAGRSCVSLD